MECEMFCRMAKSFCKSYVDSLSLGFLETLGEVSGAFDIDVISVVLQFIVQPLYPVGPYDRIHIFLPSNQYVSVVAYDYTVRTGAVQSICMQTISYSNDAENAGLSSCFCDMKHGEISKLPYDKKPV